MTPTPLPNDTITRSTPNRQGYFLTAAAMRRVKAAAKFAGLSWQAEAARPRTVLELLNRVEPDMNGGRACGGGFCGDSDCRQTWAGCVQTIATAVCNLID